jgi:hypothetical protein
MPGGFDVKMLHLQLAALAVLAPLAALGGGGEVYPVEELAGGSMYLGLARFGVALAGSGEAAVNPAGLAYAENLDVIGSVAAAPYLNDALFACFSVGVVKPMRAESATLDEVKTLAALGVGLHQLDQGTVSGRDAEGNRTGREYRTDQSLAEISLGTQLGGFGALGLNLKVLSINAGERADSGFGLDLGLMLRPGGLRVGLSAVNVIPPGISLAGERTLDSLTLRAGVGYELFGIVTPTIEALYVPDDGAYRYGFNLLVEPWSGEWGRLAVGGGYDVESERWGAVFMLRMEFIEVTYARYEMGLIGPCHSIRLSFSL